MAVLQGHGYIAPPVLWDAGLNGKLNKVKNNGSSTTGRCLKVTEADF